MTFLPCFPCGACDDTWNERCLLSTLTCIPGPRMTHLCFVVHINIQRTGFGAKIALKDSFGKLPFESLGHLVSNVHLYKDIIRRPNLLEPARLSMDQYGIACEPVELWLDTLLLLLLLPPKAMGTEWITTPNWLVNFAAMHRHVTPGLLLGFYLAVLMQMFERVPGLVEWSIYSTHAFSTCKHASPFWKESSFLQLVRHGALSSYRGLHEWGGSLLCPGPLPKLMASVPCHLRVAWWHRCNAGGGALQGHSAWVDLELRWLGT